MFTNILWAVTRDFKLLYHPLRTRNDDVLDKAKDVLYHQGSLEYLWLAGRTLGNQTEDISARS